MQVSKDAAIAAATSRHRETAPEVGGGNKEGGDNKKRKETSP
jgi:hypothetical protein